MTHKKEKKKTNGRGIMLRLLCADGGKIFAWLTAPAFTFTPTFLTISQARSAPGGNAPSVLLNLINAAQFIFGPKLPATEITGAAVAYRTRWAESSTVVRKSINGVASLGRHVSYVQGQSREILAELRSCQC